MKILNKSLLVASVFCMVLFKNWSVYAQIEEEVDTFYKGYKAYLKKDFERAVYFWTPLAKAGNLDAQYKLGMMYLNGEGVEIDFEKAGELFQSSAKQGDAGAQFIFGEMSSKGMGVDTDFQKAGNWFRKAAEQDYPDAQFRLGQWYAAGKGGEQELKLAYVWLKLAGVNGIQPSDEIRGRVEKKLRPKSLEDAKRLAFEMWKKLKGR